MDRAAVVDLRPARRSRAATNDGSEGSGDGQAAPDGAPIRPGTPGKRGICPESTAFRGSGSPAFRETGRLFPSTVLDMNRRYAYRDYEILVSAQPAGSAQGWRPE